MILKRCFCSIVPPHMLKEIARKGTPHEQACAWHTLALSEQLRGQRLSLTLLASLAATATGGKRRTIYFSYLPLVSPSQAGTDQRRFLLSAHGRGGRQNTYGEVR